MKAASTISFFQPLPKAKILSLIFLFIYSAIIGQNNNTLTFTCPADTVMVNSFSPDVMGFPILLNEELLDTMFYNNDYGGIFCYQEQASFYRMWTIKDTFENIYTCQQKIGFEIDYSKIKIPENITLNYCNVDINDLGITGNLSIFDIPLSNNRYILDLIYIYKDEYVTSTCIKRKFSVLDWCNPEVGLVPMEKEQLIYLTSEDAVSEEEDCQIDMEGEDIAVVLLDTSDGSSVIRYVKTDACLNRNSSVRFFDDGGNEYPGLYHDQIPRNDTIELCASAGKVDLIFVEFGLAEGDTLFAYQGALAELGAAEKPFFRKASGDRISSAFGGWIHADDENKSGCLTFIFKTNGDNHSGVGWDCWWDCSSEDNFEDSDGDTVSDSQDVCDGGDDLMNTDGVGMPDACDCDPNDPNDEYIDLSEQVSLSEKLKQGLYRASFQLSYDGDLEEGDSILFYAGKEILLKPGFYAPSGSYFQAKIHENCEEGESDLFIAPTTKISQANINTLKRERPKLTVAPNPFRQATTINYFVPKQSNLVIMVYNIWGEKVKTLTGGEHVLGNYEINFNTNGLQTGTYYLTLVTEEDVITRKLLIIE